MLKAPPSEASDSTRPCSTSPRGLCSFNARRKGSARRPEGGVAAVPPAPSCQGLAGGFALAILSLKGEPAAPGPTYISRLLGAARGERDAGHPLPSCCHAHALLAFLVLGAGSGCWASC